jgi:hypothetical protein
MNAMLRPVSFRLPLANAIVTFQRTRSESTGTTPWKRDSGDALNPTERALRSGIYVAPINFHIAVANWGCCEIDRLYRSRQAKDFLAAHASVSGIPAVNSGILFSLGLVLTLMNRKGGLIDAEYLFGLDNPWVGGTPVSDSIWKALAFETRDWLQDLLDAFNGRRNSLKGSAWLDFFCRLISLSALKSALIDLQIKSAGLSSDLFNHNAIFQRINSVYMAIVSLFCWSSKLDVMSVSDDQLCMPDWKEKDLELLAIVKEAIRRKKWESRGIKSTKEYLVGLGSGYYNDGTYRGLYVQRYGLQEHRRAFVERSSAKPGHTSQTSGANPSKSNSSGTPSIHNQASREK